MNDVSEIQRLRDEIERMLAAALQKDVNHAAELKRRDELHIAETGRRDQLHIDEMERRDQSHVDEMERREQSHVDQMERRNQLHVDEMALLATAIESRDTIGQAKGVIMVTMGCTADEAFKLLKDQSQHENRKVVEVAAEIAARAQRKRRAG